MAARGQGKSDPFSIRLAMPEDRFVREEAKRLRQSRGTIVEAYTAEAIRMRRFPGIAFRGEDQRRRAWVLGTGLDVWEIVALVREFGSEQKVVKEYELTPGKIRVALAYYNESKSEIEEQLTLSRRSAEELSSRFPFIQSFEAATTVAGT